jgi:hypothetical protein
MDHGNTRGDPRAVDKAVARKPALARSPSQLGDLNRYPHGPANSNHKVD